MDKAPPTKEEIDSIINRINELENKVKSLEEKTIKKKEPKLI